MKYFRNKCLSWLVEVARIIHKIMDAGTYWIPQTTIYGIKHNQKTDFKEMRITFP